MAEMVSLADCNEVAYQWRQTADKRKTTWGQIRQELAHGMPSAACAAYLRSTVLLTIEEDEMAVGMANESGKDSLGKWMSRRRKVVLK